MLFYLSFYLANLIFSKTTIFNIYIFIFNIKELMLNSCLIFTFYYFITIICLIMYKMFFYLCSPLISLNFYKITTYLIYDIQNLNLNSKPAIEMLSFIIL